MKYVVASMGEMGSVSDPTAYMERLPTFADELPGGARAYATAAGHYNYFGKRCVKDLALERVVFGDASGEIWLEIGFRHNCWKHDEDLAIRYWGVSSFALDSTAAAPNWTRLGSVILDEVLPAPRGCSHEIACLAGSLTIICRDLTATWVNADCPDKTPHQ
jgi:hypothetical protein